jgi:hypothetical protein
MSKDNYRNISKQLVNNILHPALIEPNTENTPLISRTVEAMKPTKKELVDDEVIKPLQSLKVCSKQT